VWDFEILRRFLFVSADREARREGETLPGVRSDRETAPPARARKEEGHEELNDLANGTSPRLPQPSAPRG